MPMFTPELLDVAQALLAACRGRGWHLATAESCTGGLLGGCLTELAGASDVVDRGFITYSNDAKQQMLGVRETTLAREGAVSELCAREMAEGALRAARVDLALAVTGIAGPAGATATKPIGLVHIAAATGAGPTLHRREVFQGDRRAVRLQSVAAALELGLQLCAPSKALA
jgi:nicotinamide-nucleotide amidase